MNALTLTPSVVKDELLAVANHSGRWNHINVVGQDSGVGALFLGSDLDEFRTARAVECWNLFQGVESPTAEMDRLRALDLRSQQLSVMTPREYPSDPGTGPWVVVDQFPAPLLYLTPDGFYSGLVGQARVFYDWDEAVDEAELMRAHAVQLCEVSR